MALAALGVVFGDIGTSPLYTLSTCFSTANAKPTLDNTLGIISLLIWALIVVVCLKYVTVLLRVDHEGEGGILALLALSSPPRLLGALSGTRWLIPVVVIAAAMLIGDGMITPAISVISAVEGLDVATTAAQPYVVPISAAVLLILFLVQSRGTQRVGAIFGPVMLLWFIAIGWTGVAGILAHPEVLAALNPLHALGFVTHHGVYGFLIFGGVILCLTGAEALYADLSHFGRGPITQAWYAVVFPALILNYLGQGSLVMHDPKALASPFYALAGGWMLLPMIVLATLATVIASQALISGAFTLTEQAIAMNLCPRFKVLHTSSVQRGQVYVPFVNALLAFVCLLLVVTFRSSDRLAAAYGLAVACTMLGTTIAFYVVATRVFKWNAAYVIPVISIFAAIDALFVASGLPKFLDGAWVPLAVSAAIATVSLTWLRGRRALARSMASNQEPVAEYLERVATTSTATDKVVLLTNDPTGVPFIRHHHWLPDFLADKTVVLLNIAPAERPYVESTHRTEITQLSPTFFVVRAYFGYMEHLSLHSILRSCGRQLLPLDDEHTAFLYAVPAIVGRDAGGMRTWQRRLFMWLTRVSRPLTDDLEIPPERRVGLGAEVAL
jgi:KUP system potassium uptake protein